MGGLTSFTDNYNTVFNFNNFGWVEGDGFSEDYPGAIVTNEDIDNTITYLSTVSNPKSIRTLIIDFIPRKPKHIVWDGRNLNQVNFALYTGDNGNEVAWNQRIYDGETYINGEINTILTYRDLANIRHVAALVHRRGTLAVDFTGNINGDAHANNRELIFYRVTGFAEILTPAQIAYWYEKNKPK